jgi:bifunctional ADP-heptose synthase (sugar kinase/adenylyltransferase)
MNNSKMNNSKRVLVIGDTMIDHYVFGEVRRLNPEAKHTVILNHLEEKRMLGGAANVAANLASVGDCKVDYLGVISDEILDRFHQLKIATTDKLRQPIIEKKRFICGTSYLLRVDEGERYFVDQEELSKFLLDKSTTITWDLIVISDYQKGTISKALTTTACLIAKKQNCHVIMDTKNQENFDFYEFHANQRLILKSNQFEPLGVMPGGRGGFLAVFRTRGENGCDLWCEADPFNPKNVSVSKKTEVKDVVGAGDSFLVGMACSYLINGLDFEAMAVTGNRFAEAKIKHFGTYVLTKDDLK